MLIGLTGGIGSGKSTIGRELRKRGYKVYDCDREAKRIIAEDAHVQQQIIALLGEEAFVDGVYNTSYVAKRVFAEPALLQQLNAIVHPAVREDIHHSSIITHHSSLLFIESAILIEAGLDKLCDKIVYVDAPEELRVARTVTRDKCDADQVRARIHSQHTTIPSDAIVLCNDGTQSISDLTDQLLKQI